MNSKEMKTMATSKYIYLFVIQGYYGFGWEDVTAAEDRREARDYLRDYRENEPQYAHRMIRRRELAEVQQ